MTRRTVLRGLPLLLALPRLSQAQETWVPAGHPLNDPSTCLGWWLTTPLNGSTLWRDLLHQRVGTLTSMAGLTSATSGLRRRTTRPGGWGHLAFDGTNDTVVFPDLLNNPTALSVSLWLRTTLRVQNQGILTRAAEIAGASPGWYLMLHDDPWAGSLGWWVQTNGNSAYAGLEHTASVADDRWHHVVATAAVSAGAWSFTLWIDGRDAGASLNTLGTITTLSTATLPRLGAFGNGSDPWLGAVDDVRLYNRVLSASAARLLYADSRLGYPTLLTPGPTVAYAIPPSIPTVKLPSIFFSP